MSEIQVVAIITPAKGKESQVRVALSNLAVKVKENEADVIKYQLFEQTNSEGGAVFVVEETYKDQAAFDGHFKTDYFQALGKSFQEENLLGGPLDIKTIKPIAGFASR